MAVRKHWVSRFSQSYVILAVVVFLLAFSVRLLSWHDTRLEVGKVQTTVTENYKHFARLLRQEGARGFFSASSPLADTTHLGHPPGYSIFIALIGSIFGDSDNTVQIAQIAVDALCAVLIFLIVIELFSLGPALLAGSMAAFSPQCAWNSVLLLPDTLAIFPILLAVYLLARSRKRPQLIICVAMGVLVGISCWLRANAMLLTFFFAAAVLFWPANTDLASLSKSNKLKFVAQRWRFALAVVAGTLLIILPLTIRNAIVSHRFIPVSLGAGQTLLEGIADYDASGRFNIPATDLGIVKQEAEMFQRPDYLNALLNPDGVERERGRLRRGLGVIRAHPFWFAGVMVRRAGSMLKLERTRLVSTRPGVTRSLDLQNAQTVFTAAPTDMLGSIGTRATNAKVFLEALDSPVLTIAGDHSNYGPQVTLSPVRAVPKTDYVLEIPVRIEHGRMRVSVGDSSRTYTSAIIEPVEGKSPQEQPVSVVRLPFVAEHDHPLIELSNEASTPQPLVHVGTIKLYELGPARFLWTRYPRLLVHGMQRLFLTAVILPLAILGLAIVIKRRRWDALIILAVVPLYYLCVQSAFHTEYRYVLAINYFLFAFAAVAIYRLGNLVIGKISPLGKARES